LSDIKSFTSINKQMLIYTL